VQRRYTGKPRVVVVDRDDEGLNLICRHLAGVVEVAPVREWEKAWKIIHADPNVVAVLVDQSIGTDGSGASSALGQVRAERPTVRRVLVTTPGELAALLDGLHSGVIERVVYKPINRRELVSSFVTALPQASKTA